MLWEVHQQSLIIQPFPLRKTLNKNVGFSPKIVEQFSNGYTFKGGHNGKNKYVDEETEQKKV